MPRTCSPPKLFARSCGTAPGSHWRFGPPSARVSVGCVDLHEISTVLGRRGHPLTQLSSPSPYGRTRMIVFPLRRSVGFSAATASSRVATLPMLVRSRPSRTRWTISLSWAR